jgi:S1-C subfamily serine protease/TPR repeat protein
MRARREFAPSKEDSAQEGTPPFATAWRIAGGLLVANAFFFLLELLVRKVRPIPVTGVVYMMGDLGLGLALLVGKRAVLNPLRVLVVVSTLVVGLLVYKLGWTELVVQWLAVSGALLLLLLGTPGRLRTGLGIAGMGVYVLLSAASLLPVVTDSHMLHHAWLRMRGEIDPAPVTRLTGELVPYTLEVPPGRWYAYRPQVARERNPLADRWLVLPEKDAHLLVITELAPGISVTGTKELRERVLRQRQEAVSGFQLLQESELPSRFDRAFLWRTQQGGKGQRIEMLMGLFIHGDRIFQVLGFAGERDFKAVQNELLTAINSFAYEPPRTPPLDAPLTQALSQATVLVMTPTSTGSGFVATREGDTYHVVTNEHVVRQEDGRPYYRVEVVFLEPGGGRTVRTASVVQVDEQLDLAVLSTRHWPQPVTPLRLRRAVGSAPPQPLYVVGYPFGTMLGAGFGFPFPTFNPGAMLPLAERKHPETEPRLLIDAGINPGNSGGPVVDAEGHVLGVAVAHFPGSRTSLLIPSDQVGAFLQAALPEARLLWVEGQPPVARAPPEGGLAPAAREGLPFTVAQVNGGSPAVMVGRTRTHSLWVTPFRSDGRPFSYQQKQDVSLVRFIGESKDQRIGRLVHVDGRMGLAVVAVESAAQDPEPLLLREAPIPETSWVTLATFRGGPSAPRSQPRAALQLLEGAVSSRQYRDGWRLGLLQLDAGIEHDRTGGPILDASGGVVGFVVKFAEDTNVSLAVPAARISELLHGQLRDAFVRHRFDGVDRCAVEVDVRMVDPVQTATHVELLVLKDPASAQVQTSYWRQRPLGETVAQATPGPEGRVRLKAVLQPCGIGPLVYQLAMVGPSGRRLFGPYRLDVGALVWERFQRAFQDPELRTDPADLWSASNGAPQDAFVPPEPWARGCPDGNREECYRQCLSGDGVSCYRTLQAIGSTQMSPESMVRACRSNIGVACAMQADTKINYALSFYPRSFLDEPERVLIRACAGGVGRSCQEHAKPLLERSESDVKLGLASLRRGCDFNAPEACQELARFYLEGPEATRDPLSAANLLQRACNLLDMRACVGLAELYRQGKGVPANAERALELSSFACDVDGTTCISLARTFQEGLGVPRNPTVAQALLKYACAKGAEEACSAVRDLR